MDLSLATYRDYVEKHSTEIFEDMYLNFNSANVLTHVAGNKGEETVPVESLDIDNFVQKWKELSVNDGNQSWDLAAKSVRSYLGQFHEKVYPSKLQKTYMGFLLQRGQDPMDFPFAAYVVMTFAKMKRAFLEKGLWKSVADGGSTSGLAHYDGLLKQVTDAITATDITPNTFGTPYLQKYKGESIPAGFESILTIVETMYHNMSDELRESGGNFYMANKLKVMYNMAYRNVHGNHPMTIKNFDIERPIVDGTEENPWQIVGVGGMSGSERIIGTPLRNAIYTYDAPEDLSNVNIQQILNALHHFGAFRYGSKFLLLNDTWVVTNELP